MTDQQLITPEQAAVFLGVNPGKLIHFALGTGPPANEPPVIRLARVEGLPMVYLEDIERLREILNPLKSATIDSSS